MLRYTTRHYIRLHYTIPHYTTQHYSTLQYTTLHNYTTPQLQLQLQVQLHYTYYTLQLQLHYTTLQLQLQLPAPHYIQQLWVRCTTATIANCPKNTTSTTFRSISRFALPSVIVPKSYLRRSWECFVWLIGKLKHCIFPSNQSNRILRMES